MACSGAALEQSPEFMDVESARDAERARWVLEPPEPPSLRRRVLEWLRGAVFPPAPDGSRLPGKRKVGSVVRAVFPIVVWGRNYRVTQFKKDLMAGLTLVSLSIPQSIGYATLARLNPQYGLYTSVVPPLIYAVMGSSRELAIGPVAVVSLLIPSMLQKIQDPMADPPAYTRMVLTVTTFAGIFQAAFGILRLGFVVDFLSHAGAVGFMAGAAILIGCQQLKGLLGVTSTTDKMDVVSVTHAAIKSSLHHPWSPYNLILGCSFLLFILSTRFLGARKKKLFWVPAMAPLAAVILSTLIVFVWRMDRYGVKTVKHIKGGFNPLSLHQLQFNTPLTPHLAKIGFIIAIIALTEAIAVGRSFATIKGYHLDGNREMVAMGVMNIVGSFTSCYVATGSFSRTAVNFSVGCETPVSNIVMAITVAISLQLLTKVLYFTPTAILASIILSALPGLIDLHEARRIWRLDKLDFLACAGAFIGVLFASVEIGLIIAVTVSFGKIILNSVQTGIEVLGKLPATSRSSEKDEGRLFVDVNQYPMAHKPPPRILVFKLKSPFFCFANSNSVRERIIKRVIEKEDETKEESTEMSRFRIELVVLDVSNLASIDTSGIASLEELHKELDSQGTELAIVNPSWTVMHKLKIAGLVEKIGGKVFLTVGEAVDTSPKMTAATVPT